MQNEVEDPRDSACKFRFWMYGEVISEEEKQSPEYKEAEAAVKKIRGIKDE